MPEKKINQKKKRTKTSECLLPRSTELAHSMSLLLIRLILLILFKAIWYTYKKKISQLQPILPKKMYLLLPVSVIARLFRKVTHQTCHSLNKHSPLHTRLFARLARPFLILRWCYHSSCHAKRSCPSALWWQIKSFWLESRIARLIIMLIEQFSVFFSLLHTVQFGKKAYSVWLLKVERPSGPGDVD